MEQLPTSTTNGAETITDEDVQEVVDFRHSIKVRNLEELHICGIFLGVALPLVEYLCSGHISTFALIIPIPYLTLTAATLFLRWFLHRRYVECFYEQDGEVSWHGKDYRLVTKQVVMTSVQAERYAKIKLNEPITVVRINLRSSEFSLAAVIMVAVWLFVDAIL